MSFVPKTPRHVETPAEKPDQAEPVDEAEPPYSSSDESEDEGDGVAAEPRIPGWGEEEEEPPQTRGGLGAAKAASSMFQHFGAAHVQSSAAPSASESPHTVAGMRPRASGGGIGSSPRNATIGASSSGVSTPASAGTISFR